MHIAILEDDPDQLALFELWVGSGQHSSRAFALAADFIEGVKKERFDLLMIGQVLNFPASIGKPQSCRRRL